MNIDELLQALKRVEDHDKRYAAIEAQVMETAQAVAEILALLSKQGPDMAKAIADALAKVKMPAAAKQDIRVEVPPITIPPINVPAATVVNDWRHLQITYAGADGSSKTMDIKRVK